jgi:two-component system alkaline phosphatase synthesis response regulator PhoP
MSVPEVNEYPVVIVDDEPDVLELIHEVLCEEGLPVIAVAQPDRAINVATETIPRLFLVDLMLPGCDGIELARRLRQMGLEQTPMVAMSASKGMLTAARTSDLFDDTLAKPFDLNALLDCVDRLANDEARSA